MPLPSHTASGSSLHSHLSEPAEATLLTPKWAPNTQDRGCLAFSRHSYLLKGYIIMFMAFCLLPPSPKSSRE